jgi:glycosyltransferase involved in cell wall biosynthesis
VLLVGPYRDDPGGVASYYNSVLPQLSASEFTIRYLEIGRGSRTGFWLHKVRDQVRFWRELRLFDPHLVHINPQLDLLSFVRDGLFLLGAKARRKPVLVFYHGWRVPFERYVSTILHWFFRHTYGRGDSFIVLARRFKERLQQWGVSSPIHLGFTAVDDQLLRGFSVQPKTDELLAGAPLKILFLGRLVAGKGLWEFLDAIERLCARGVPVRATVAGDGPLMTSLQLRIEQSPTLGGRVDAVGYVTGERKARILREHHIFCMPTTFAEGLPTALLEAMAFGLAIVTCPAGGIGDFFEDGRMGSMLEGPDPALIANAIAILLQDRAKLATVSRHNHHYALKLFLASGAANFLRRLYLESKGRHRVGDTIHPNVAR